MKLVLGHGLAATIDEGLREPIDGPAIRAVGEAGFLSSRICMSKERGG
jgi:hypothetical protein